MINKKYMATYNVNMKQFNGTSFDDVLPFAYDSKLFDGKTYSAVKEAITDGKASLAYGTYVGSGTFEIGTPVISLSMNFTPQVVMIGYYPTGGTGVQVVRHGWSWAGMGIVNGQSGSSQPSISFNGSSLAVFVGDGTTQKLYYYRSSSSSTREYSGDIDGLITMKNGKFELNTSSTTTPTYSKFTSDMLNATFNNADVTYYWVALGGGKYKEKPVSSTVFTQSGTFTVPYTGYYSIELHGKGGNAVSGSYETGTSSTSVRTHYYAAAGGGSGAIFNDVLLTAGDTYSVAISDSATFGDASLGYTVSNGGDGSYNARRTPRVEGGVASGNLASDGGTETALDQDDATASGGSSGCSIGDYGTGGSVSGGVVSAPKNGAAIITFLRE